MSDIPDNDPVPGDADEKCSRSAMKFALANHRSAMRATMPQALSQAFDAGRRFEKIRRFGFSAGITNIFSKDGDGK